jgi:hypothetical protein
MIKYSSACFFLEKRKFTLSQRANFFARLTPLKMLARSHLNGIWVYFLLEYCFLELWSPSPFLQANFYARPTGALIGKI